MRRTVTNRTGERMVRLAYDLAELASRLDAEGYRGHAAEVYHASSKMGDTGRSLLDELERKREAE